ncbi:MAG: hypothetical protein JKY32_08050 [Rhizobiales bacterium]|nr:hypothetical protein [Hyphomicrobiales bacterium]
MNTQQKNKLKKLTKAADDLQAQGVAALKSFEQAKPGEESVAADKHLAEVEKKYSEAKARVEEYQAQLDAKKTPATGKPTSGKITITAKKDGFRRCGMAHPAEPTTHPAETFTAKELAILEDETMLVVVRG